MNAGAQGRRGGPGVVAFDQVLGGQVTQTQRADGEAAFAQEGGGAMQ